MSDKKRKLEAKLTREQIAAASLLAINKFLPRPKEYTTPEQLAEAYENGQVRLHLDELAQKAGASVRSLYGWRHQNKDFIEYVNLLSTGVFSSYLPEIFQKHLDMTLKGQGSMKGIELFYKFGGLLVDKSIVNTEATDTNLSTEERLERLKARTNSDKADE